MEKSIFLDFDGTISDAHSLGIKSMIKVLEEFKHNFNKAKLLELMGEKMEILFKKIGLNEGRLDASRKRFYKYFKKGVRKEEIKLCVSAEPLWELKKQGYKFIVVSNSETSLVNLSVKKLGIRKLFKKIYGAEKFETKDKFLIKLFKKYKINPKETMYIGDRFSDVKFAKKAGCISVAINNKCSWSKLSLIKKEKPDYIIEDFRGLKKILNDKKTKSDSKH